MLDDRIAAVVVFDLDDFDAAIAELDARYLAGEAASHSHVWSIILEGYSAVNHQELPPMTSDFLTIDHRRGPAFGPGEMIDYVRAGWGLDENVRGLRRGCASAKGVWSCLYPRGTRGFARGL